MRKKRTSQISIFDQFAEHEIGRELSAMSDLLDAQPELLDGVCEDLSTGASTGRNGMTADSVLRCAILKQYRQLSYEELAFHLVDSASFQAFARLAVRHPPSKASLQANISAIKDSTWEGINQQLMHTARASRMERGTMWRLDSTAIAAPVHAPSDSTLLLDSVNTMVRLLRAADALSDTVVLAWHDHTRRAKKRAQTIRHTRGKDRKKPLYRDLVEVTKDTMGYLTSAVETLDTPGVGGLTHHAWKEEVEALLPLVSQVLDQTERRVFNEEKVPSADKIVSLFEPHTDIIVKDGRNITYGHKLNLTSGRSGLVFDVVVEDGNPADSERFMPMLERHIASFGTTPRQVAADGGYASKANLAKAKDKGVQDVAFHKRRGLIVEKMVKSQWVYRKLRNFRAGIEAGISCLKRAYGLTRCTWKGLAHFKAYVWSSVVSHNLALMARLTAT